MSAKVNIEQRPSKVSRRGMLAFSTAAAALALPSIASAQRHVHGKPKGAAAADAGHAGHGPHAALLKAVRDCLAKGEACLTHCLRQINKGDITLVDCLKTVSSMLPLCRAMERYAVIDSKHLRELAAVCITVNEECAAECHRHADHHETCKACEEACKACIAECKALTGKAALLTPFAGRKFALTTHDGKPWTSASLVGRPTAIFFGYTSCPDVCPTSLMELTNAMADIGDAANGLQAVFVTLDPDRDTVALLKQYLASFDRRIVGLTGDVVEIEAMATAFLAHVERKGGGIIDHSASVYLLGPDGRLVDRINPGKSSAEYAARLKALTAATASADCSGGTAKRI